jgi:hypothetical protein
MGRGGYPLGIIRNQQAAGSNPAPGSIQNQLLPRRRVVRKARLVPPLVPVLRQTAPLVGERPCSCDRLTTRETAVASWPDAGVGILGPSAEPREDVILSVRRRTVGRKESVGSRAIVEVGRSGDAPMPPAVCSDYRPPTSGSCTTVPTSGHSIGLTSGASFVRERWVRAQ